MNFTEARRAMLSTIYPNATIDTPVDIGEGTQIWHFTHVMDHSVIGDNCTLGQGVHVAPGVIIGNRCAIQNGVQLFTGVTLEDDVFVGPCAVFTNVRTPRAFVDRKQEFRLTRVMQGASIGANATILCGVKIGEYAMIGAGAVVTEDVRAHRIVVGNPAREIGWACRCGVKLSFAQDWATVFAPCPGCATRYQLVSGRPTLLP